MRVIGTVAFFVGPEVLRMKLIQRHLYVFEQMTWDKAETALLIHKSIEVEAVMCDGHGGHEFQASMDQWAEPSTRVSKVLQ